NVRLRVDEGARRVVAEEIDFEERLHRRASDRYRRQRVQARRLCGKPGFAQVALRRVLERNRRERRWWTAADVGRADDRERVDEAAGQHLGIADPDRQWRWC